jgi:hypothetical protein
MVDEAASLKSPQDDWSGDACRDSKPPQFYVSQATVSDLTLLPSVCTGRSCLVSDASLNAFFAKRGLSYIVSRPPMTRWPKPSEMS